MTREEMLNKLKDSFKDFVFYEDDHHYEYKGERIGISVTRLIEEYCNEFDAETIAEKVAIKEGKTIDEVLNEWKHKNKVSCEKGHFGHEFSQSLWSGNEYIENISPELIEVKELLKPIKQQAKNFYNDYKDRLEHLADEFVVGSIEFDLCSAIDHLFINKLTGGLVLVDYKTNSDIHKSEKYAKSMKIPLSHLKDFTLIHYYIQLSIYKYLIEKYTGLKVEEMFIVYMSENIENYEIIDIPYLKEEVEEILELRKVKKMSKIILVMGEPATGKTVSLRNIPKNELYYIDCDKKGLNYKGWKNDFNEENKNYCRTTDSNMIAKILKGISNTREDIKYVAIDTINSVMLADEMRRSKDKNFDKWVDLASSVYNIIVDTAPDLRDDMTVIFIGHTQTDD